MRSAFLLLSVLFFSLAALGQVNARTNINWPPVTGNGAPTLPCTTLQYGMPYQDISVTPNVWYTCGSDGWKQRGGSGGGGGLPVNNPTFTGTMSGPNVNAALQPQNAYLPDALYNGMANMQPGSNNSPSQIRLIQNGDSTAGFHNVFVACSLGSRFGSAGFDMGGIGGPVSGWGQPCIYSGMTNNSISGTVTVNNGASSIVPGTGAPYDYTRSPTGVMYNISSGSSITWGSGGVRAGGNVLKVYYLTEPSDGIYHATPGTLTVTATSSATGPCSSGCTLFTGSLNNPTYVGGVVYQQYATPDGWTITASASGGAVDVYSAGIYDTTHNGIIFIGGSARPGLSLPDSVSTPTSITAPWYASVTAAPLLISAWSCSSTTTCTFTYSGGTIPIAGQRIILGNFQTTKSFNGLGIAVTSATSTSFTGTTSVASASSATESGYGWTSDANTMIMFEMKDNGGSAPPNCTQASSLNPGVQQPYSYWITQYMNQWSAGNPIPDFEFTGSYDLGTADPCIPVHNDQMRQVAASTGAFYYDNFYPQTFARMGMRGQIADSVHSNINEQIAGGQGLVRALGIETFLGAESRPVDNALVDTLSFWIGNDDPRLTTPVMCNPADAPCLRNTLHLYTTSGGGNITNLDVAVGLQFADYNHTNCYFWFKTVAGGATPTCQGYIDGNGLHFGTPMSGYTPIDVNTSTSGIYSRVKTGLNNPGAYAFQIIDMSNPGARAAVQYEYNDSEYWEAGLVGNLNYRVYDPLKGAVVDLPQNTMPASSIGGNANGATAITQTAGDNSTNIATDAFVQTAVGSVSGGSAGGIPYVATESGASNAYAGTSVPSFATLTTGQMVLVLIAHTQTTATPTLNVNGTGAKTIRRPGNGFTGLSTTSGDIVSGFPTLFQYDGTYWNLLTPPNGPSSLGNNSTGNNANYWFANLVPTGTYQTVMGRDANVLGTQDTVFGSNALFNTGGTGTANQNAVFGYSSLKNCWWSTSTGCTNNAAFGWQAGYAGQTTIRGQTSSGYFGANTGSTVNNVTNQWVWGYNLTEACSNCQHFGNTSITATYMAGITARPTQAGIATAATIAPTQPVFHITDAATTIATITVPTNCTVAGWSCRITAIPDAAFTTNTTGNIAATTTAVVGKPVDFDYDPGTSKWYPSY